MMGNKGGFRFRNVSCSIAFQVQYKAAYIANPSTDAMLLNAQQLITDAS